MGRFHHHSPLPSARLRRAAKRSIRLPARHSLRSGPKDGERTSIKAADSAARSRECPLEGTAMSLGSDQQHLFLFPPTGRSPLALLIKRQSGGRAGGQWEGVRRPPPAILFSHVCFERNCVVFSFRSPWAKTTAVRERAGRSDSRRDCNSRPARNVPGMSRAWWLLVYPGRTSIDCRSGRLIGATHPPAASFGQSPPSVGLIEPDGRQSGRVFLLFLPLPAALSSYLSPCRLGFADVSPQLIK